MTIKKIAAGAGVSVLMFAAMAGTAFAAPNQQACFGQGRSEGVALISGQVWGDEASDRAGDNAAQNATYRDGCQA